MGFVSRVKRLLKLRQKRRVLDERIEQLAGAVEQIFPKNLKGYTDAGEDIFTLLDRERDTNASTDHPSPSPSDICGICGCVPIFDNWLDIHVCAHCGARETENGWQGRDA
jgi:hypothetical protein